MNVSYASKDFSIALCTCLAVLLFSSLKAIAQVDTSRQSVGSESWCNTQTSGNGNAASLECHHHNYVIILDGANYRIDEIPPADASIQDYRQISGSDHLELDPHLSEPLNLDTGECFSASSVSC